MTTGIRAFSSAIRNGTPLVRQEIGLQGARVSSLFHRNAPACFPTGLVQRRNCFKVVDQFEEGVTLTFGKHTATKGPGLRIRIPLVQEMMKVDMRIQLSELPKQQVITHDNISIFVDAVVQYRVVDTDKAVFEVSDYKHSINELAQLKLRGILSQSELNDVLHQREKLNTLLLEGIKEEVAKWGIELISISIKDISFDPEVIRAMSKKAEALRAREAQVIAADAEVATAQKFREAADILLENPGAMELRKLETLLQVAKEKNTVILFPASVLDKLPGITARSP